MSWRVFLALSLSCSPLALPSAAQDAATSAPGVTFELRLKDGKTQFRQGERITIELVFSSTLPDTYRLNTANYDRSGRLHLDEFLLYPREGVADPMEDYFRSLMGFLGGGLHGIATLSGEPRVVTLELNDRFRFDRTGTYRLRVVTPRVSLLPPPEVEQWPGQSVKLTSNEVFFQIIEADPAWSGQELADAVEALGQPSQSGGLSEEARHACLTIRFLGTPAAVREMVRRLGQEDYCGFDWMAGLMGSPHRELVLKELEEGLASPWQPVTGTYLGTLSTLAFLREQPAGLKPPEASDKQKVQAYQEQVQRLANQQGAIQAKYALALWKLLPSKQDPARVTTLHTLWDLSQHGPAKELAGIRPLIVDQIASSLPALAPNRVYGLLEYQWRYLAHVRVLPALQQIYERPPTTHWPLLPDLALRRIHELSPGDGRRLILGEIQRLEPRVGIEVLRSLPDETLEEFDETLITNLEESRKRDLPAAFAVHCGLVERYATARILPRVKKIAERDAWQWWGDTAAALLAYVLRADPEGGLALIAAGPTQPCDRCPRKLLSSVAALYYTVALEKLGLELLDHAEAVVAEDAANMLRDHGSVQTKEQLWRRLARWNKTWEGREKELRYSPSRNSFHEAEARLESALTQALARASAWVLSAEELDRLATYCLTKQCRQNVDSWRSEQAGPIHITSHGGRWHLGSFQPMSWAALLEKVWQFPPGSDFAWLTNLSLTEEDDHRLYTKLESAAAGAGVRIRRW
ncbi:MAG: hypothetical protein L0Z53_07605 [Acidobacteriales bacterium]|nr:hypothetical protein [Terriglobales bacterium]